MGKVAKTAVWAALLGAPLACGSTTTRDDSGASGAPSGGSGGIAGQTGISVGVGSETSVPPIPVYPRDCIEGRLLALAQGSSGGGAGGMSSSAGGASGAASGGESGEDAGGSMDADLADAGAGPADLDPSTPNLELGAGDLTLLVIFDKSGSMADRWDSRSKWQVANEAFMSGIREFLPNLTIGAILFPQPSGCDVAPLDSELQFSFEPGSQFATHWEATSSARGPDGSTPLELAFRYADMAIERACGLGLLDDRFRVIVITDGEPNCNTDVQVLVDLAADWTKLGVETHVLGLPGSTAASDLLNAIARAGGTGTQRQLGQPDELDDAVYELAE